MTAERIQILRDRIDAMSHEEMARNHRFAPTGSVFFDKRIPEVCDHFRDRFQELGGMTSSISKRIGWD